MKMRIGVLSGAVVIAVLATAHAGQEPGDVVSRFQEAYRAGSAERMLEIYAEDATFEDVNQRHTFTGHDQLRAMLASLVNVHHHMSLEEIRRVIAGDVVVVEYAYTGQLDGKVLGASVGKEGCPDLTYRLPATSWFTVKDGRITRQKDYLDWATFLDLREQMLAAGKDAPASN